MSLSIVRARLQLCVHGREEEEKTERMCERGCGRRCVEKERERDRGEDDGGGGGGAQRRDCDAQPTALFCLLIGRSGCQSGESGTARRADYEVELKQRQSPFIVSMAAHAFLLCSLALLSALSRPGLSFTEEELRPGVTYEEVPEILDRR